MLTSSSEDSELPAARCVCVEKWDLSSRLPSVWPVWSLCTHTNKCVSVLARPGPVRLFARALAPRHASVCLWLGVRFVMCAHFLFPVQESPSGPRGVSVPACQKRLHLLDPLEAGDSQMSLGPSTEWWEEDRKGRVEKDGDGGDKWDRS